MPRRARTRRQPIQVESLSHTDDSRTNIPSAEMEQVMDSADRLPIHIAYERRNRDLDPQLVWSGKDEQDARDLIAPAPPLFIQEKVHPKVLVDDLMRFSSRQRTARRVPGRPVLRLQRPAVRRRQDRVLPARRPTGRTA